MGIYDDVEIGKDALKEASNAPTHKGSQYWYLENKQRQYAWDIFRAHVWNHTEEAMVISFDTDMIPSGEMMWYIKHCELRPNTKTIFVKISTYLNNIKLCAVHGSHTRIATPVPNPVGNDITIENRCHGVHFNSYGGPAQLSIKYFSTAENGCLPINTLETPEEKLWAAQNPQAMDEKERANGWYIGKVPSGTFERTSDKCVKEDCSGHPMFIPWVVANNPDRYPWLIPADFDRSRLPTGNQISTPYFQTV